MSWDMSTGTAPLQADGMNQEVSRRTRPWQTCSTPATVVDHPIDAIIGTMATDMLTLSMLLIIAAMEVMPRTCEGDTGR